MESKSNCKFDKMPSPIKNKKQPISEESLELSKIDRKKLHTTQKSEDAISPQFKFILVCNEPPKFDIKKNIVWRKI